MNNLSITHCNLGNDADILLVILRSDVTHIDLSHNNIGSSGAVKISEYMESNPPVNHLNLGNNSFNDADAVVLARALKKNTNLTKLELRENNFTVAGAKTLFAGIFDSSSLNTISESNHTCSLHLFLHTASVRSHPVQSLLSSLNRKFDRASKVLAAIHES